jgi:hypothetical protein
MIRVGRPFTSVRELQRRLKAQGAQPVTEANEATTGPAGFTCIDTDGNQILVDPHRRARSAEWVARISSGSPLRGR